jgi:L-lactate dehydrogenase (cytochrome)/(S)-mandelate dehydrogenase
MARQHLPRLLFDWIDEGAGDEAATRGNLDSFRRHRFLPRYLRDVSERSQATRLFDRAYASPFGFSPTGMQGLIRPGGEVMMARAAAEAGIPYILSGLTTKRLESVAAAAPNNLWFQPYPSADCSILDHTVERAVNAGVNALVVTADLPVEGLRMRSLRNRRSGRVSRWLVLEALRHPRWVAEYLLNRPMLEDLALYAPPRSTQRDLDAMFSNEYAPVRAKQTWAELARLRRMWPRTLVLKGIVSPGDAIRAVEIGVDGIILSNHGGRQLDRAPSPLDVLPLVKAAVAGRVEVMLDGGIRRGSDIVTALCLGARFVFIGRAALYGLAAGGQAGVARAIELLRNEIDVTLGQIGCTAIDQLDSECMFQADGPGPSAGAPARANLTVVR